MSQGIFIGNRRPKSKKEVKEAVAADPENVYLEATSWLGNEYGGSVASAPEGSHHFVGPDPYVKRTFYGTIEVSSKGVRVK